MSRLDRARRAVRPALRGRALLSGPSGSGKTRSALMIAEVLADGGPILVIDTERESALTYADDFAFEHLLWEPPFNPRELASTLLDAGPSYEVIIVDSMSHFWRGTGGVLDIAGGKFTGWADARPAQLDLVDALLRVDAHFLGCARAKVEHVQEMEGGRHVVRKLGMAVVQDDDLEYELNVALELSMDHAMTVSKSRTVAVPVGRTFHAGHAVEFAELYKGWLAGGEPPAPGAVVAELVGRLNALPNDLRPAAKQEFLAQLGRPEQLRESLVADARALVERHELLAADADAGLDAEGEVEVAPAQGEGEVESEGDWSGLADPSTAELPDARWPAATVRGWVGTDPARAALAVDAEAGRARPRQGLLEHLEALVAEQPSEPTS